MTHYRPEIDGLRALAVMPVLFFHAGFSLFSGGFIGVDIFFVISGYLITSILQREISSQSFSIVNFYERRARRILPALLFISLLCIPFAYYWMLPLELKSFFDSLIAINLFSSNVLFWQESDYFSAAAELKPLLHTWSLSVEEQFYVFFPLFLLFFNKFRYSILFVAVFTISLLSLLLSDYASVHHSTANFYLLPTRIWELGLGALLAISPQYWMKTKPITAQIGSIMGIVGITFSIFYFDNTTPFPGRWALIPVLSTVLLIAFSRPNNLVGRLLGWKPLTAIGLMSYSTYLWHQPLFAFARIRMPEAPSALIYIALIVASLLLAYLTWRFIETPFRNKKRISRQQIFVSSVVLTSLLIGVSFLGHFKSGIFNEVQLKASKMEVWKTDYNTRAAECHGDANHYISPEKACTYNQQLKKKIAIWGDSHALGLAHIFANTLSEQEYDLTHFTYSACIPAIGIVKTDVPASQCTQYNDAVLAFIDKSPALDIIVMHGRWPLYLEGTRFNNHEGGLEYGNTAYVLPLKDKTISIASNPKERIEAVGKQYRKTVELLLEKGKKVVLVYSVPEAGWNVPAKLARDILFDKQSEKPLSTSFSVYKERVKNSHQQLDLISDHKNLIRIYPSKLFCDTEQVGRCVNRMLSGEPLYFDDNHLNSIGALQLSKKIVRSMLENQWINSPFQETVKANSNSIKSSAIHAEFSATEVEKSTLESRCVVRMSARRLSEN